MTKYIKGKDGKFAGSIGDGKTRVPTCAPMTPPRITHTTTIAQPPHFTALPEVQTTIKGLSPSKHHFPFTPITTTPNGVQPQAPQENPLVEQVSRFQWKKPCPRKIVDPDTKKVIWKCGNTDPHMRSMNGASSRYCYDCQGYDKVISNSRDHGFEMTISRQEYITWRKGQDRKCFYCGIAEHDVHKLEVRGSQGTKPFVESLGTDRWDSTRGYDRDNIVLACQACNQLKSETHGDEFMEIINVEALSALRQRKIDAYNQAHQYCCNTH